LTCLRAAADWKEPHIIPCLLQGQTITVGVTVASGAVFAQKRSPSVESPRGPRAPGVTETGHRLCADEARHLGGLKSCRDAFLAAHPKKLRPLEEGRRLVHWLPEATAWTRLIVFPALLVPLASMLAGLAMTFGANPGRNVKEAGLILCVRDTPLKRIHLEICCGRKGGAGDIP